MPSFVSRNPNEPAFWNERFAQQFTPWDIGGVPLQLRQFVASAFKPYVTYIPGCGLGHEIAFLAKSGWQVSAIDFSPDAVAAAQARLGPHAHLVRQADFFAYRPDPLPELIYERAFLCALPKEKWPAIVERWMALLPADGLLAGFFFFDDSPTGPPFGADPAELEALLKRGFIRIEDIPVTDSAAVFAGRERWQVWRRAG